MPLSVYLSIAIGGAMGAVCRYGLSTWIVNQNLGVFPLGTLVVNLVGCFLLGIFYALGESLSSPQLRLLLTTGFLGAFTTFSTFSIETLDLFRGGYPLTALGYVGVSVLLGLLAAGLGFRSGTLFY